MLYAIWKFLNTKIAVEKHFDPPKCDFWRGLEGASKNSQNLIALARHILWPPHKLCCNSTTACYMRKKNESAVLSQYTSYMIKRRGVDPGSWGLDFLNTCRRDQSMLWPVKNVTFFHSKLLLLDNYTSFISSRMKDLCQKWKVKLIFRGV